MKKKPLEKVNPAGLYLSGQGMGSTEGPIEFMMAGLLGALGGFVVGLLAGTFTHLFTLNRLKGVIGGRHWAAWGAGAGALALMIMELFD